MPRVPIATENRTGEGGDRFPKIKLQEKGEKTRFTVIEVPWREFVHYVKVPEFDESGRPVMETKKRRDGTEYQDYKTTFVGSPICLGDEEALRAKGLDEANCPVCAASVKSGGDIPGPVQKFSVNVVEYALKGNTWDIKKPFSAEIKIWVFNGRVYDEIEAIQQEIGDLRRHDITLECEDPFWQRNKLAFKMEPGFNSGDKEYLKELLNTPGNKATEQQLKDACGRDTPRARMQDDCDHALRQWRRLRDGADSAYESAGAASADLAGGIDDLLAEEAGTDAAPAPAGVGGEGGDPFGLDEFTPAEDPNKGRTQEQQAESAAAGAQAADSVAGRREQAAAETAAADDFSFDDLLGDIG